MIEPTRFSADDVGAADTRASGKPSTVECPSCGTSVEIAEALTKGIREQAQREATERAERKFQTPRSGRAGPCA